MLAVSTDVGKLESVAALFAKIGENFGRLDVLFNNAGVSGVVTLFEDITFNHWQNIVNINLAGALSTTARFRRMRCCPALRLTP